MYKQMLEQLQDFKPKVELTIFILFDLSYQITTRVDFMVFFQKFIKILK